MPAETGVDGLVVGRGDGSGRDAELNRASSDFSSRADGLFDSVGVLDRATGDVEWRAELRGAARCVSDACPLASGALDFRTSLARLDLDVAAVIVWARVGFGASLVSVTVSGPMGRGFRACATASGPAHCGIIGSATLARTKLDRTVTGRTFSVIFP